MNRECILVVKNKANSYRTGEVVSILDSSSKITDGVSKKLYEEKHGLGSWKREFVLAHVTDIEPDDPRILEFIKEPEDDSPKRRLYRLTEQDESSPYYDDLVNHAEVYVTYAEIAPLQQQLNEVHT